MRDSGPIGATAHSPDQTDQGRDSQLVVLDNNRRAISLIPGILRMAFAPRHSLPNV